jgi:hypothetical protein
MKDLSHSTISNKPSSNQTKFLTGQGYGLTSLSFVA